MLVNLVAGHSIATKSTSQDMLKTVEDTGGVCVGVTKDSGLY